MAWLLALAPASCAHADAVLEGREALQRGDYAEARRQLSEAVDDHPDDPSLWRDLARAHMRDGALPEARMAIARADDLRPGHPATVLLRAQVRMNQGDRAGARKDALWVADHARRPRALQEVAVLFVRLGMADEAMAAARAAVDRSDGAAAAYTNLAVLAVEARRLDVAAAAFAEGRALHPEDIALAEAEAAFLLSTGQLSRARTTYEALLPHHPRPALIHLAIALLAHEARDLDAALEHSEQAVALAGHQRPDVHYTHVVILRDRGDLEHARRAVRRGQRKFPGHPGLSKLAEELRGALAEP